jgi:pimeloyl-ACP methyl ester carboxylesterase
MKEVRRDNAVIDYQVSGNGNKTLLFVHGSYIDKRYWNEQVKYFSADNTVVTLDLPGHGQSGRGRKNWLVEDFAKDVVTLTGELNLKNVILIGHSLGADISLIAATSYSELFSGFIAIDYYKNAATPLPQEFQPQIEAIKANLKKDFPGTNEQYARTALLTPQTPSEIVDRVIKDYRNAYEPMGMATMPQIFDIYKMQKELLPKLKFKLHLINVDYIPTNEELLKKHVPSGYDVMYMKGTCHFPMLENAVELNRLLQQVIDKIPGTKSVKRDYKATTF